MLPKRYKISIQEDPNMPRVGLYLTNPQIKRLKDLSKKTGLTLSDLIRRSLDDWIDKYEEKERKRKRR
jgi:hypothetical protein